MIKPYKQIYETSDYDIFKFLNWNRPILPIHVKRLRESFEEEEYLNPILVIKADDKDLFGILDGQHRYVVKRELNKPIHFIVEENEINIQKAVTKLNTEAEIWNIFDWVIAHANSGNQNYKKILTLKEEFPQFRCNSNYLMLVDGHRSTHKKRRNNIIDGTFEIISYEKIEESAKTLLDFKDLRIFPHSKFVSALLKVINLPGYDHKRMLKKLESYPTLFHACVTTSDYENMIIDIYNYNQKDNTKLRKD